jgi:hypothetical protein
MNIIKILLIVSIAWTPTDGFSTNDKKNKAAQHQSILDILAEDEYDFSILEIEEVSNKTIVLDLEGNIIMEKIISENEIQNANMEEDLKLMRAEFLMENNGNQYYLISDH